MTAAETLFLQPNSGALVSGHRSMDYRGVTAAALVAANWHDEHHRGAFRMCTEQPCEAVRRVDVEKEWDE